MANLVIVAIPNEDDYVWKLSSEKKPHMTICFLGDAASNPNVLKIQQFLEHAVKILEFGPFNLEVDYRGELGPDKADVLFFRRNWSLKRVEEFRGQLLKNNAIRNAYDKAPQHDNYPDGWTPHLTMGYPGTPAREDKRDFPGLRWIEFDRIALWYGDFEGPEYRLEYNYDLAEVGMSAEAGKVFIAHFGVKGMKWGVRRERFHRSEAAKLRKEADKIQNRRGVTKLKDINSKGFRKAADRHEEKANKIAAKRMAKEDQKFEKNATGSDTMIKVYNRAVDAYNTKDISRINNKPEYKGQNFKTLGPDHKLTKQYENEHAAAFSRQLDAAGKTLTNKSGTRHVKVEVRTDANGGTHFAIRTEEVKKTAKHAAEMTFTVVRDSKGFITSVESDTIAQTVELGEEFLAHYGVKGMKWGQRKAPAAREAQARSIVTQNRASKSKIKTTGGENHPPTEDAIKAALHRQKMKKSGTVALSNKELQELATRMNLEQQVHSLESKRPKTAGRKFVDAALKDPVRTVEVTGRTAGQVSGLLTKVRA